MKRVIQKETLTVEDLVKFCKEENLPLTTKLSIMGDYHDLYVHLEDDNSIILDEVNLACHDCDKYSCNNCRCAV